MEGERVLIILRQPHISPWWAHFLAIPYDVTTVLSVGRIETTEDRIPGTESRAFHHTDCSKLVFKPPLMNGFGLVEYSAVGQFIYE